MMYDERSGGRLFDKFRKSAPLFLDRSHALKKITQTACDKIYMREILDRFDIRFDERYRTAEDQIFSVEYIVRISSVELFRQSPKYHYRKNPKSATNTFSRKKFDPRILDWPKAVERRIWPALESAGEMQWWRKAAMFWACERAMQELRLQGRQKKSPLRRVRRDSFRQLVYCQHCGLRRRGSRDRRLAPRGR